MVKLMKSFILAASLAAVTAASPALAQQEKPRAVIGTGSEGNAYWNAGTELKNIFRSVAELEPRNLGGTENILFAVSEGNAAQLGLIQADGLVKAQELGLMDKIRVVGTAGREYTLVVCNEQSGIEDSDDLQDADPRPRTLVGTLGSGFVITLDKWSELDENFSNIEPVYESPSVDDGGAADLMDNTVPCAAMNSALSGRVINELSKVSNGKLNLVEIDDWNLDNASAPKAADGSTVGDLYSYVDIPAEKLPGLISGGSVTTVAQDAILIANNAWASSHPDVYRQLRGILTRNPNIVK